MASWREKNPYLLFREKNIVRELECPLIGECLTLKSQTLWYLVDQLVQVFRYKLSLKVSDFAAAFKNPETSVASRQESFVFETDF